MANVRRQIGNATSMTDNPYQPPHITEEIPRNGLDRTGSLNRAATLYRWMGWIGITYFFVAFPLRLWSGSRDASLPIGTLVGMSVVTACFVGLFTSMIRLAPRLQQEFAAVYTWARCAGLLAGAFGFPFLTVSAFYAVRLIGRGRSDDCTSDEPYNSPKDGLQGFTNGQSTVRPR